MKPLDTNQVDDLLASAAAELQQHDVSVALDTLLKAYQAWPDNTLVLNMTGRCYQILGEPERAERCWEEALAIDPSNKAAESNLNEMRRPAFRSWLKRYHEALAMLEKKNFPAARVRLRQLMEEHDEYVSLYKVLGLSCLAEGDRLEAHHVWNKGLEIDRTNGPLREYLNLPERKPTGANLKENPEQKETRPFFSRRRLLMLTGALCLILLMQTSTLLSSHRQNSETTAVLQQRIRELAALVDKQKQEPAETVATKVMPVLSVEGSGYDAAMEEYYYRSGYNAYLAKDWKNAENNLEAVVSMATGSYLNREALYYLARTYFVQKEYVQAEKRYLSYLDKFPDSNYYDDSLFYLACTYHYTGRPQQMREMLQQLAGYDPNSGYLSSSQYQTMLQQ